MPLTDYSQTQCNQLLSLARTSIEYGLRTGLPMEVAPADYDEPLRAIHASFVTLKKHADLRGCIGALVARQSLVQDVAEHAYAAAFRDPRFPQLRETELPLIHISISVLTKPEPMSFTDEADLLRQICPNRDGLVLQSGVNRGTFLPAVWAVLPDKTQFLAQLKRKAGLSESFWSNKLVVSRYEAFEFGEAQ